jgi:phage host-nuclease inhibitor protein Gam
MQYQPRQNVLSERKRSFDNRIDWLKNYVKSSMEATQNAKIKYSLFTISVAKNQPSVEVVDIEKVDAQFIRITKEVDKTKILEQMKATGVIPDGINIKSGTHLSIR